MHIIHKNENSAFHEHGAFSLLHLFLEA